MVMKRTPNHIPRRHPGRTGCIPYRLTRPVPALSTRQASARVLSMASNWPLHGWLLDPIGWPRDCRDRAGIQSVTRTLAHCTPITKEV
jgi:hypothetical protein